MIPIDEQPYPLPNGWQWVILDSVAEIIMGQSPKGDATTYDSSYTPLIGGAADMGEEFPSITRYTKKPTKLSSSEDVIICIRATLGKPIFSDSEYCLGRGVAALRPRAALKDFIRYALINFEQYLYDNAKGTTFLQIASHQLKRMPIPLPPPDEQQRIVSLLDELFGALDEAKALAQAVVDGSKLRRATILHKAFIGELTKLWRDEHGITLDSWQRCQLSELLLPMQTKRPTGTTFRYIDIDSIDNERQSVREPKIIETVKAPSRAIRAVYSDNVLFSMVRPYLKNVAFIDENLSDCIASTGFFVCRCKADLLPKFLYHFLCFDGTISYLTQFMKGDNSPSIRKNEFLGTPINLPPLEEQKEIVRVLDDMLYREQRTKDLALKTVERVELMKKSILARAFRGELNID